MERSGWFDDDEDGSSDPTPQPPPGERPWRHPSELGRFGSYGPTSTRRRTAVRLAGAAALGGAGTIVFVALASMHVFGNDGTGRANLAGAAGGSLMRATSPSSAAVVGTHPVPTTEPTTTSRALAASTTQQPAASMPPWVGVRVGGAAGTIPAVIDDEGWLVAGVDELGGADQAEAVLDDGRLVHLTVESVDTRSGVARLRPDQHVDPPADQAMAWMGVTCEDAAPTSAALPASSATSTTVAATVARTTVAVGTTAAHGPSSLLGPDATTGAPSAANRGAGGATTVPPPAPSSTMATGTQTTGTGAGGDAHVVSTAPVPTSTSEPATTASDPMAPAAAGVRVQVVHDGGPASQAGLRRGDLIVALEGRTMLNRWALVLAVRHHAVGETVHVTVERDGRLLTFAVVLAAGPSR